MLVKTLLNHCETGFSRVIVADSTTGHTMEYSNVKDAQIEAGGNKVISWETGYSEEIGKGYHKRIFVLLITI